MRFSRARLSLAAMVAAIFLLIPALLAGCGGGGGGGGGTSGSSGSSSSSGSTGTSTPTATPSPSPTIASVNPNTGSTNGGTVVTIAGANFQAGALVTIGGNAAAVSSLSATSITATTPAGTAGAQDVRVINPDLNGTTLTGGFTYTAAASAPTITGQTAGVIQDNGLDQTVTFNKTGDPVTNATVNGGAAAFTDNGATISVTIAASVAQGKCSVQLSNAGGASNTVSVAKLAAPTSAPGATSAFVNVFGAVGVAVSGNTLFVSTNANIQLFNATTAAAGPTVTVSNAVVGDVAPDGKFWVALSPTTRAFISVDTAGNASAVFPAGIDASSVAVESNTRIWVAATNSTSVRQFSDTGTNIAANNLTLSSAPQAIGYLREANALVVVNAAGEIHLLLRDYATPVDLRVGSYTAPGAVSSAHVVAGRNQLLITNAQGNGPVQAISLVTGTEQWSVGAANGTSVTRDAFAGNGRVYVITNTVGGRVESAASN